MVTENQRKADRKLVYTAEGLQRELAVYKSKLHSEIIAGDNAERIANIKAHVKACESQLYITFGIG